MSVQIDGSTGNIIATKADYSGDVSIGGTLTYEDVTNIDSVGIITARSGINVTGGDVGIGLTNPEDYGNFADDLVIYDSSQPGMTFASGTSGYGSIYFADGTAGNAASRGQIQYGHSDDYMAFATAASEALRITSDGDVGIGDNAPNSNYGTNLSVHSTATDGARLKLSDGTTGKGNTDGFDLITTGGVAYILNRENADMSFSTNNIERLRITSAGDMGLGTATPTSFGPTFQISGTDPALLLQDSATAVDYYGMNIGNGHVTSWFDDSAYFAIGTAAGISGASYSERLRITSGGLVGVNCTPLAQFQVKAGTNQNIALSTMSSEAAIEAYNDAGSANVSLRLRGLDFKFFTSSTERLRIDSNGRLMIGTNAARTNFNDSTIETRLQIEAAGDNDSAALSIISNAGTTNSDKRSGLLVLGRTRGTSNGSNTVVVQDDQVGMIEFKGMDGTSFSTAASIKAQVDAAVGTDDMPGRLVFSTTADGSATPTERMRINSAGTIRCLSTSAPMLWARAETSGSVTALAFYNNPSSMTSWSGQVFRVMCDGDVENSNNNYGAISDIKLKENIVDAGSQWDDIKGLRVRKYNFKESTGLSTHTQIGLVAQEAETVSPGLVKDRFDSDETGKETETVTKSVNYSVLYMKAVKALQEAQTRIETLETQKTAQQTQIDDLLARVNALEG